MGVQIIMYPDDTMPIYIVISCNDTVIGKMIRKRGELKFWNRYKGDCYTCLFVIRFKLEPYDVLCEKEAE